MKYILTRRDIHNKWQDCRGTLHVSGGNSFVFYFDKTTDNIGLNDGKFHCLNELKGFYTKIYVGHVGIFLEGCFIGLEKDQWHRDGFLFKWA